MHEANEADLLPEGAVGAVGVGWFAWNAASGHGY